MKITHTAAHELVAAIPLEIGLESYRERLIPLARATLSGGSRRQIDRQRDSVLPDVWDEPLARVVAAGVAHLRRIVGAAEAGLARPARASRVAGASRFPLLAAELSLLRSRRRRQSPITIRSGCRRASGWCSRRASLIRSV